MNIDVEDLPAATEFYTRAFDLHVGRRFDGAVELIGASSRLYLLAKDQESAPFAGADRGRDYRRHWTPVHIDFVVADLEEAVRRAEEAGARLEAGVKSHSWGRIAVFADPFGHGFCLLQFSAAGYDAIAIR